MRSKRTSLTLAPEGVFWSIQGEGHLVGTPMVFIRVAGCSFRCDYCDADHSFYREAYPERIIREVEVASGETTKWVWITGGEPTEQPMLHAIVPMLRRRGFKVALATNGTRMFPSVDYLSVSPHDLDTWIIRSGDELKITDNHRCGIYFHENVGTSKFIHKFIQPRHGDQQSLRRCVEYVRQHPGWRLSLQANKSASLP